MAWANLAPLWITGLLAFAAFLFVRRYGGSSALSELERANRILERRVKELEHDNARLTGEVAALTARTDVALAVGPVLEALKLHEERAADRSEKHLAVLALIADRLGAETEAA